MYNNLKFIFKLQNTTVIIGFLKGIFAIVLLLCIYFINGLCDCDVRNFIYLTLEIRTYSPNSLFSPYCML